MEKCAFLSLELIEFLQSDTLLNTILMKKQNITCTLEDPLLLPPSHYFLPKVYPDF